MANTKSALKRMGTSRKRHERNVAVKSATRTFVKKARTAIAADPAEAQTSVVAAISALDVAAKKGVIHPNNAARRKSRLMKRFNVASAAAAAAAAAPVVETPAAETGKATKTRATRSRKKS